MPVPADAYPSDRIAVEVSLWSADLTALGAELERLKPAADVFHIDASDATLTATPLFFPDLVRALRSQTRIPFHIHLMARRAQGLAERFADAGADLITVHVEADDTAEALTAIRGRGIAAGLALKLETPVESVAPYLQAPGAIDAVLAIGTPLGTQGATMSPQAPRRLDALRRLLAAHPEIPLIADGGIRLDTVEPLAAAGADALVAGSLVTTASRSRATATWLRRLRRYPRPTTNRPRP